MKNREIIEKLCSKLNNTMVIIAIYFQDLLAELNITKKEAGWTTYASLKTRSGAIEWTAYSGSQRSMERSFKEMCMGKYSHKSTMAEDRWPTSTHCVRCAWCRPDQLRSWSQRGEHVQPDGRWNTEDIWWLTTIHRVTRTSCVWTKNRKEGKVVMRITTEEYLSPWKEYVDPCLAHHTSRAGNSLVSCVRNDNIIGDIDICIYQNYLVLFIWDAWCWLSTWKIYI